MVNKSAEEFVDTQDDSTMYVDSCEDPAKKQVDHYSLSYEDHNLLSSFLILRNQCFDQRENLLMDILQGNMDIDVRDALGQTPLHLASNSSHHEMIEFLLSQGAQVNATDLYGKTALHLAAARRDVRAVELLISRGANPRLQTLSGFSPLILAVQAGCTDIVEILVNHGCDVNELVVDQDIDRKYTCLHTAVERNFVAMVETLLRCKADVNKRDGYNNTSLHYASRLGRLEIAQLLLAYGARIHERDDSSRTALFFAVEAGHKDLFDLLVLHGADLNDRDNSGASLLHLAIKRGDIELVDTLLSKGADVNVATKFGKSPVHWAIVERKWSALEQLLSYGADVNHREYYGKTPLHSAIEYGRKEAFEILLRHNADTNAQDNLLQTPLHAAVREGCPGTVELLLQCGAHVDAKDNNGQTPLRIVSDKVKLCYSGTVQVMLKMFAKHLVKKNVAGFSVSDAEAKALLQREDEADFKKQCADEVKRMSATRMFGDATYYDFLRGTRRSLVSFVKNQEVVAIFEQRLPKSAFPIYADMLQKNYAIGKRFEMILDDATERLDAVCNHELPNVPVEKIVSYLDAADMKNLLAAVPTLPIAFAKEEC